MRRFPTELCRKATTSQALLRQLHALSLTSGSQDSHQWSELIRGYLSHGLPEEALLTYTQSLAKSRTHQPMLPLVVKGCASLPFLPLGQSLHADSIKAGMMHELFLGTAFVSMLCKCGRLVDARRLFDEMPERNAVTYNALIGGYLMHGDMESASILLGQMASRTPVTWAMMIKGFVEQGDMVKARRLFEEAPSGMRTVVMWTVIIHGYATKGEMEAARELFDCMPARNCFVWSSMISGYFKRGNVDEAQALFDRIPVRNLVNWNALISGYSQLGCCEKALEAFSKMQETRLEPDEFTMASVLSACAQSGSLEHAISIHEYIIRKRIKTNLFVLNGLVDMYAKCGDLESARKIFDGMSRRNRQCWNSMISGLANHGRCEEALELFAWMEESEVKPDEITFLAILVACTHGGMVKEGLAIFAKMDGHGLMRGVEHYGCLVDLLGRAGKLTDAYDVIKKMPMKPNEVIWGALLGACRVHIATAMTERLMHEVNAFCSHLGSANDTEYSLLSNIFAAAEQWEEAERMRRKLMENGIKKTPGCSSIVLEHSEQQLYAAATA